MTHFPPSTDIAEGKNGDLAFRVEIFYNEDIVYAPRYVYVDTGGHEKRRLFSIGDVTHSPVFYLEVTSSLKYRVLLQWYDDPAQKLASGWATRGELVAEHGPVKITGMFRGFIPRKHPEFPPLVEEDQGLVGLQK